MCRTRQMNKKTNKLATSENFERNQFCVFTASTFQVEWRTFTLSLPLRRDTRTLNFSESNLTFRRVGKHCHCDGWCSKQVFRLRSSVLLLRDVKVPVRERHPCVLADRYEPICFTQTQTQTAAKTKCQSEMHQHNASLSFCNSAYIYILYT